MVRGLDGYFYFFCPYLACAVFKLHRASRKIPVVHSERETPLPIPNRAVKPFSADGTWGATPWESRSPPVFLSRRARPARSGSTCFCADVQEKTAQAAVVEDRVDIPALRVSGFGQDVVGDLAWQLGGEFL